ncbi:hypothetical protein SCHPADRAFT_870064 [Schizopora paradoxa]|uniref:Sld7 C-terminal domain-containing protein n=1 Tax=Schizopora paradoxa TaxID=27342 RepID=A0A0H2RWI4_9AGAM|nr:hypothetical protein SCHPADRAFT_870064 [Schizopora paradoxa]
MSSTETSSSLPELKITASTPPKPLQQQPPIIRDTTPRLLYRGALSLPDSHLLLDGLTFTIDLPTDDQQASLKLLETPLPLALEILRGRPSLSFIGVERLDAFRAQKLGCEYDDGVNLHIHPRCTLTRQLFTHNLCTRPIDPETGRTILGIRIRLGDGDASKSSSSNDIVVYGQIHPSSSIMLLRVARIVPLAPTPALPKAVSKLRPPRPDDPTPRLPPVGFSLARIGLVNSSKRPAPNNASKESRPTKKPRKEQDAVAPVLALDASVKELGKKSRIGQKPVPDDTGTFKVPSLPPQKRPTEKAKDKGKAKEKAPESALVSGAQGSDVESKNKMFVKKRTVDLLTSAGITKNDPEFKEFFNAVYKGTTFALRVKMRSVPMEEDTREASVIERIVQAHVSMYLSGRGIDIPVAR